MLREIFRNLVGTTNDEPRTAEEWKARLLERAITQRERDDVFAMFDRAEEDATNRAA